MDVTSLGTSQLQPVLLMSLTWRRASKILLIITYSRRVFWLMLSLTCTKVVGETMKMVKTVLNLFSLEEVSWTITEDTVKTDWDETGRWMCGRCALTLCSCAWKATVELKRSHTFWFGLKRQHGSQKNPNGS